MNNAFITSLEEWLLPKLEAIAKQLRREFPRIQIQVWSSPIGRAVTDNHAHNLGIDCLFPYAPPEECDNVGLEIGVLQVKCNPLLSDLGVWWGAGSSEACVTTDLLENHIPWSPAAREKIEASLPILEVALRNALRHPPFPEQAVL